MELHEALYARGLRILAFPCNQFGKQEPGSAEDIRAFADGYGVQFDIFAKTDVNGPKTHPGMRSLACVFKLGRSACLAFGILPELCFQPDTLACPPYLLPHSDETVFQFVKSHLSDVLGSSIKWNWTKFLCDRDGRPVKRFSPPASPLSLRPAIEALLDQPARPITATLENPSHKGDRL